MMEYLLNLDRELFITLNRYHADWLDPLMLYISGKLVWLPLYLIIAYFIFKQERLKGWIVLVCIALTILLADQVTSSIMKPYFERFRPSHDPELHDLVHIVNGDRGGKYGFASSHAANTFGLALFVFLLFRHKTRIVIAMFVWAAVVSYSRIYLGLHFPGDILIGAIVGLLCGTGCFYLYIKIRDAIQKPDL